MIESLLARGKRLLSAKILPRKSIAKFIITFPLIVLVCYVPVTYMAYEVYQRRAVSAGYLDVVLLEFDPSINGEIYRYIQKYQTGLTDKEEAQVAALICAESHRYGCDPHLVLALIMVESSFYSKATSSKGAKGLMQLRPYVARALAQEVGIAWVEEAVIFDPEVNIRLGLYYLSQLILQFQDIKVALAAYNFGPTYIREQIDLGRTVPTEYANKVLKKYRKLSRKRQTQEMKAL